RYIPDAVARKRVIGWSPRHTGTRCEDRPRFHSGLIAEVPQLETPPHLRWTRAASLGPGSRSEWIACNPTTGSKNNTRGVAMRSNRIKQMWRAGQCVTLGWLSVSHGFTAEVMARQGFDALCVDLQHGTSEMKDVGPLLQAISQTETVPVVRVAWNEPAAIMKALDLGAYCIIVPLVNNAEEAAKAVAACRYPPVGMRSSGPVRAVHYGGADYVANANNE